MIIRGRFFGDAPYFSIGLAADQFHGFAWFLADTGASHTTLLDRDLRALALPAKALRSSSKLFVGVGGSVRSYQLRGVRIILTSDQGDVTLTQDLWVIRHDLRRLPPQEAARLLRLPSVLGRDIINQFEFTCDYRKGVVQLSRA